MEVEDDVRHLNLFQRLLFKFEPFGNIIILKYIHVHVQSIHYTCFNVNDVCLCVIRTMKYVKNISHIIPIACPTGENWPISGTKNKLSEQNLNVNKDGQKHPKLKNIIGLKLLMKRFIALKNYYFSIYRQM